MTHYPATTKTKLKRLAKRANYEHTTIHQMIDEALIAHVGFNLEGQPCIIPTAIMRVDNAVYIHGSRVSRMLKHLASGAPACIVVTHTDGLVLARSGFHHSMNYRSAVIYGQGVEIKNPRKTELIDGFVEHLIPGRMADVRPTTRKEINATTLIEFELNEVSAKIREGGPVDDAEDYALPIWAGVIPLNIQAGKPITDTAMASDISPPEYAKNYTRR